MLLPGIYRHPDGSVVRVQLPRHGRRPYSKTWTAIETRRGIEHIWRFDRAKIEGLQPDHLMTLDEARQISRDAGQCLVCAARLSDPKSQADGIGPVCRRRFADWQAAVAAIRADLQLTDEEREHRRIVKARASVRARLDGERIILTSDYDDLIVSIIRTFEGSTWDDGRRRTSPYLPYHGAHWSIPREHATALAEAFAVAGIAHDDLAIIGMGLAS